MDLVELLHSVVRSIQAEFSLDEAGKMRATVTKRREPDVVDTPGDSGLESGRRTL